MSPPTAGRTDFTRRTFLKTASSGAAVAAAATTIGSTAHASGLSPKEQFLLDRITFGRTPELVAEIQTRGYTGFLNWQLQLPGEDPLDDSGLFSPGGAAYEENMAASAPWSLTPNEILYHPTYSFPGGKMWRDAPQLLLRGGEFGQHQLRWVMTDFFQNVHNTYILQPFQYLLWAPFLKNVVYEHALGSYADMVKASGQGGSMLLYLGQPDSNALNPNENYGRELLELHTMGVESHDIGPTHFETFEEADIAEVARILTGWDMHGWYSLSPLMGDFQFDPTKHAGGNKTVSNTGPGRTPKVYPGALGPGQAEGEELILDLCSHQLTALFISRRLIQWFIGDDYKGQFYDPWVRTAVAFYLNNGDIKATLRTLFNETFFDQICPPGTRNHKVRRPINKVLAFKRSLNASIDYASPKSNEWYTQQYNMGQVNGAWPAPNGYQPQNEKWLGTMQPTVQFYFDSIFGGTGLINPTTSAEADNGFRIDETLIDDSMGSIFAGSPPLEGYAGLAAQHVLGDSMPTQEVDAITSILQTTPLPGDLRRWALFYVFASPTYQFLS